MKTHHIINTCEAWRHIKLCAWAKSVCSTRQSQVWSNSDQTEKRSTGRGRVKSQSHTKPPKMNLLDVHRRTTALSMQVASTVGSEPPRRWHMMPDSSSKEELLVSRLLGEAPCQSLLQRNNPPQSLKCACLLTGRTCFIHYRVYAHTVHKHNTMSMYANFIISVLLITFPLWQSASCTAALVKHLLIDAQ